MSDMLRAALVQAEWPFAWYDVEATGSVRVDLLPGLLERFGVAAPVALFTDTRLTRARLSEAIASHRATPPGRRHPRVRAVWPHEWNRLCRKRADDAHVHAHVRSGAVEWS